MAKKYNVSINNKIGEINVTLDISEVSQTLFWKVLENKVKLITIKSPDKYVESIDTCREFILKQKGPVTLDDLTFEITGKDN